MSKIVYTEDIVDEISKELKISKKEVKDICKKSVAHLYSEMMNPEVISITLPGLGVIHFNYRRALKAFNNPKAYLQYKETLKKQMELVDEVYKDEPKLVHKRLAILERIRRRMTKDKKEFLNTKRIDIYNHIEKKQNK